MGLFGNMNSWALRRMAKENFQAAWKRGYGCGGNPPAQAVRAIENAAETASRYANGGPTERAVSALTDDLQDYARAVGHDRLQMSLGAGVLCGLFGSFPGYEWAAYCVNEWELRS